MIERINLSSCRTKKVKMSFDQVGSPTPADLILQPKLIESNIKKIKSWVTDTPPPHIHFLGEEKNIGIFKTKPYLRNKS